MGISWDELEYLVRSDPDNALLTLSDATEHHWRWIRYHLSQLYNVPESVSAIYMGPRTVVRPKGYTGPTRFQYRLHFVLPNPCRYEWTWVDGATSCRFFKGEIIRPNGIGSPVNLGRRRRR